MNMTHKDREQGLSTLAVVLIAAVVIGGGAVLVSNSTSTDVDSNATTTADTEATTNSDSGETVYTCEDGSEIVADITAGGEGTVTLPSGEMKTVAQAEGTAENVYTTADGTLTFTSEAQEATVEQNGNVTFAGCVSTDDNASMEAGGSADSDTEADAEGEAEATTSVDVDADTSVEVEAEAEGNADAQY